jgi:acetylglutamate kinase
MILDGIATAGMHAKLEAAMDALQQGVRQVLIAPGALTGVVGKLLGGEAVGTRLIL